MRLRKIRLPFKAKKTVLAVGGHNKNTLCLIKGDYAYLSPALSSLSSPGDFLVFVNNSRYLLKKYPRIIAHDLHPEYQSTKYALNLSPNTYHLSPIQHHHAHIVSCMVENGLRNQKVIGVAFDGTGLGADNTLWGAEFLVCDYKDFQRKAHLKEIPLLGGEAAILEPARLAAMWLYSVYKDKFLDLGINFVKRLDKRRWRVLKNMYSSGFNSPRASSMGRLFDAVASLVLEKYRAGFEAELAMELEKIAAACVLRPRGYNFKIVQRRGAYVIEPAAMFREVVRDLQHRESREKIAYRFHLTVAQMIRKLSLALRKEHKINTVVLSGGVFQNNLLLRLSSDLLYREGFKVVTHKELSCNDSGISLGQAAIANFSRIPPLEKELLRREGVRDVPGHSDEGKKNQRGLRRS
jgi:hydrogenase maturation protein HypF